MTAKKYGIFQVPAGPPEKATEIFVVNSAIDGVLRKDDNADKVITFHIGPDLTLDTAVELARRVTKLLRAVEESKQSFLLNTMFREVHPK